MKILKPYRIYLVERDTRFTASVYWRHHLFALQEDKNTNLTNEEIKQYLVEACKNTIALLEKFGEKALTIDGDIDEKKVKEFIRSGYDQSVEVKKHKFTVTSRYDDFPTTKV